MRDDRYSLLFAHLKHDAEVEKHFPRPAKKPLRWYEREDEWIIVRALVVLAILAITGVMAHFFWTEPEKAFTSFGVGVLFSLWTGAAMRR